MDVESAVPLMKRSEVFGGFDHGVLRRLAELAEQLELPAGSTVFTKGEHAEPFFYMIVSGAVDILLSTGERVTTRGSGDIIGEIGPISRSKVRMRTVVAAEPTVLLRWDLGTIEQESEELHGAVLGALKDLAWSRANPLIRKLAGEPR